MKRELGAIALLEEAVNLLRAAPLSTAVVYLAGAIPFVLGLLFFLSDMTRSAFALEHLAVTSLGLAGLFIWKSVWQAVFSARLYRQLSPGDARWKLPRLILIQCALQPLFLVAPLPWTVAYFRNVAMFAAWGDPDPVATAWKQAGLWTRQNWSVLGLATLTWLLLFANLLVIILLLPELARSLLGIEGDSARLGIGILNVSTVAVAAALAWLAIDPLLDAVYALRCFYGESLATGEDLRAALRRAVNVAALVPLFIGVTIAIAPRPMLAQAGLAGVETIDPIQLDRSINEVIHRREFTWRAPRPPSEEPRGRAAGWYRSLVNTISDAVQWVLDRLNQWFKPQTPPQGAKDAPVTPRMLEWLIGLTVALAALGAVIFFRGRRRQAISAEAVTPAAAAVDLADESLTADQIPESSWRKLAEEWLAKGDCRLALRALYLAGLNYLGERELISIRRWKSGLDYRRELERRARATPAIGPVFARNVAMFERGWYGSHAVDRAAVEAFAAGLNEIRKHAEQT
jgi:hypothetical protein